MIPGFGAWNFHSEIMGGQKSKTSQVKIGNRVQKCQNLKNHSSNYFIHFGGQKMFIYLEFTSQCHYL